MDDIKIFTPTKTQFQGLLEITEIISKDIRLEFGISQYENAYRQFKEWCETNKARKASENVLLAYFAERSKKVKPSTLWAVYSMLKSTLNAKENVDIKKFTKLVPYLKKLSVGHNPKKSKVLTREEVNQFIREADDEIYLMVVLILGISGACRREELTKMSVDDIEDKGSILIVKVPDTKTNIQRIFTVSNLDYIDIYRKYVALRPSYASSRRLFLKYQNKRCINQVVGINSIGGMPSLIAKYLKLPNSDAYTGHCFRRTSATLLANAGGDICSLKRHGGWKSSTVAEGYVEDSINNKIQISNKILDCEISGSHGITSTSKISSVSTPKTPISRAEPELSGLGINIGSCTGCTINVNIVNNN
ncbi:uncharacterized protein LOC111693184 [Anoplophora glabripennis]|uniref:uncharacterized protein LOC111693184 n=1 Tax=Anoplophora glabripennis TaxID=217634 RepID=UPI000C7694FF|nr:uncharacterized protein LOC111693184 [Anoplophora glabripennis]